MKIPFLPILSKSPSHLNPYFHDYESFFSEIPSEVSMQEKYFLYWLAREWTKEGLIVEIGPFLGSTTRALAQGVFDSGDTTKKVITIDRFGNYYNSDIMASKGVYDCTLDETTNMPNFFNSFLKYHQDKSYFSCIEVYNHEISDNSSMTTDMSFIFQGRPIGCLFIDGCKSWFSLIDVFSNILPFLEHDSYVVFQDYKRVSCFWIPIFVAFFSKNFSHICSVASTSVFKYKQKLRPQQLLDVFKDSPFAHDRDFILNIFDCLILEHREKLPTKNPIYLILQKASFLSFIGEKQVANHVINSLRRDYKLSRAEKHRVAISARELCL